MTRTYWLGLGFIGLLAGAASCGDGPVSTATPTAGGISVSIGGREAAMFVPN